MPKEPDTFDIVAHAGQPRQRIYALRLSEDLIQKIKAVSLANTAKDGVKFTTSAKGDELKIGALVLPLGRVKESQPVHLFSINNPAQLATFVGSITWKLNPKLELEAKQAEAIRQRSQDAEKERLARKTLALDASFPESSQSARKLVKRTSTLSNSSTSSLATPSPRRASIAIRNQAQAQVQNQSQSQRQGQGQGQGLGQGQGQTQKHDLLPISSPTTPTRQELTRPSVSASSLGSARKPATAKDRLAAILKKRKAR